MNWRERNQSLRAGILLRRSGPGAKSLERLEFLSHHQLKVCECRELEANVTIKFALAGQQTWPTCCVTSLDSNWLVWSQSALRALQLQ